MVEGYDTEGRNVMLNPREVVAVYAGGHDDYTWWCNVAMTNGATHRFKGTAARQVWEQLGALTWHSGDYIESRQEENQ